MREIFKKYKIHIKELLNNRIYVIAVVIIAILSYGFTITNLSIGVDDLCFDRYVKGTYLISAGRWGTTVLYTLLQLFEFTPFWLEMIVTMLTVIMGIVFTAFIKKNIKDVKTIECIIITGILISYPILHQSFIYQSTNLSVIICNLAFLIIPILIYEFRTEKVNYIVYLLLGIIMPFFISMYESCCQTYILIVFIICFLELLNKKDKKEVFIYFKMSILILIIGLALNTAISKLLKVVLKNYGMLTLDYSSKSIPWFSFEVTTILNLIKVNIIDKIHWNFINIPHIRNFIILATISLIITIYKSIKEKNFILIPMMLAIIFSNFIINFLQIRILYRVDTSWCIAIAFFTIFILKSINKKTIQNIVKVLFCIIILFQTKDINQYFYKESIKYQREANYMRDIANEIILRCKDTTKPIINIYREHNGQHSLRINEDIGWCITEWGASAFADDGVEITKFMNSLGYNFNIATEEEFKDALNNLDVLKEEETIVNRIYETEKYIYVIIEYNV